MIITKLQTVCSGLNIARHPDMWVEALPWVLQNAAVFETSEIRPFKWASNLKEIQAHNKDPRDAVCRPF